MVVFAPWQIVEEDAESVGGSGFGLTVIVDAALASLTQPADEVQVAVYEVVVFGETVILAVVALVFQVIVPEQPEAVIVELEPWHIVVEVAESVGGAGFVFTVITEVLLTSLTQPLDKVQVAVYEVVVFGETVILAVVTPVFHVTVPVQPEAVIVVLAPTQIVGEVAESVGGVGFGFTVITDAALASLTQPVDNVQVAVYEVVVFGETVILTVVAPVFQVGVPEQPVSVRVVLAP